MVPLTLLWLKSCQLVFKKSSSFCCYLTRLTMLLLLLAANRKASWNKARISICYNTGLAAGLSGFNAHRRTNGLSSNIIITNCDKKVLTPKPQFIAQ